MITRDGDTYVMAFDDYAHIRTLMASISYFPPMGMEQHAASCRVPCPALDGLLQVAYAMLQAGQHTYALLALETQRATMQAHGASAPRPGRGDPFGPGWEAMLRERRQWQDAQSVCSIKKIMCMP